MQIRINLVLSIFKAQLTGFILSLVTFAPAYSTVFISDPSCPFDNLKGSYQFVETGVDENHSTLYSSYEQYSYEGTLFDLRFIRSNFLDFKLNYVVPPVRYFTNVPFSIESNASCTGFIVKFKDFPSDKDQPSDFNVPANFDLNNLKDNEEYFIFKNQSPFEYPVSNKIVEEKVSISKKGEIHIRGKSWTKNSSGHFTYEYVIKRDKKSGNLVEEVTLRESSLPHQFNINFIGQIFKKTYHREFVRL
ncbi:MAG: hypothetical protein QE271_14455 [Bacteriovoracaceae bacterium]|nr:hypothetical protein [Bacteriovoracaceae bacterium]